MRAAGVVQGDAHLPVDTDKIVGGSKLLGQMRNLIRRKHYSIRTEQAYLEWARRYLLFHGKRHPGELGEAQIVAFLNHLAVDRKVAASTQNQALNALVFLCREQLGTRFFLSSEPFGPTGDRKTVVPYYFVPAFRHQNVGTCI